MAGTPDRRPPANLPDALRIRLSAEPGLEIDALEAALAVTPPISIRINPWKPCAIEGDPVPWCANGRYLADRPVFTLDPAFHGGAYYVQEASSMLLEQAVHAAGLGTEPVRALDLCAAPGGKSTHLSTLLPAGSLLVSNEVVPKRRAILRENLWKWGAPNVVISGNDPRAFAQLTGLFDLVLVDAPCSGEGMFRKDPFAREQWTPQLVDHCSLLQRDILQDAWTSLRPGGTLVYSTCTWERSENEDQLASFVAQGAASIPIHVDPAWGVVEIADEGIHALRCYPHRVRGEGFFLAVLRKPGDRNCAPPADTMNPATPAPEEVATWLNGPVSVQEEEGVLHAIAPHHADVIGRLCSTLRLDAPGIPVAERKGKQWRPHPALALSTELRRDAFPQVELDRDQALDYLRGNALRTGAAVGTALAVHQGLPLGWLQGAGNRWNNGWPAPWRIRMRN